jgi:ribose-phosphate pyrophosphokinase
MKILSGRSHKILTKKLAEILNIQFIETNIEAFNDQELRIQITSPLYEEEIVIVQSTSKPANDHLMELLLLIDAAKRGGAKRIIAVMPYFGYSRQDRLSYDYGPISASLVSNLLTTAGIDHLITIDLHSKQTEGFFRIGIQNLESIDLFGPFVENFKQHVIVSPDIGGLIRARKYSEQFNLDLVTIDKNRGYTSKVIGNVKDKHCIIIDDIADTAETLCKASEALIEQGALSVKAFVTHAVLSGTAIERIENSDIERIFVTDSIPHPILSSKFQVVPTHQLLAESIKRIKQ